MLTTTPLPTRLSLVRPEAGPHWIDGAWWPHSRDLTDELPILLASLNHRWGRITRVTVHTEMWPACPRRMPFTDRVVHINRSGADGSRHKICLLSYGVGRCDLLVVAPDTPPAEARRLMAGAARHSDSE
ncbi:DUF5994 family protein [Streptomyces sp. NPDC005393]|uniref:DUF5994 family protein n=1 Tax=Streptomyces sp. NPDC005393 TaxID=3157041 RepID=UPI0033B3932C